MTTEQKIKPLLDEVVKLIKDNSFVPEYQGKATAEECLGIAIAKYLEWDNRIFTVCVSALEDANFHSESELVENIFSKSRYA